MSYGSSMCNQTGYSDFDERDRPEPEEEEREAPMMENAFLQPTVDFVQAVLDSNVVDKVALHAVLGMLKAIPVQSAYCPVCMDQFDAPGGELAAPTVVKKRSCGHYACDRCARHCADIGCSHDGCDECMAICEGHAQAHCREHVVAKNYCCDCAPEAVVREINRPAYVYEACE